MKITITFDTSSAAFDDANLWNEVHIIMDQARAKIFRQLERNDSCICTALEADDKLLDSNGNTIGILKVKL